MRACWPRVTRGHYGGGWDAVESLPTPSPPTPHPPPSPQWCLGVIPAVVHSLLVTFTDTRCSCAPELAIDPTPGQLMTRSGRDARAAATMAPAPAPVPASVPLLGTLAKEGPVAPQPAVPEHVTRASAASGATGSPWPTSSVGGA